MSLLSGLSRLGGLALRGITSGFGLAKRYINSINAIRGLKNIKRLAQKVGEIGGKISSGLEVAKNLPIVGEKVQDVLKRGKVEEKLGDVQRVASQVGGLASQGESIFSRRMADNNDLRRGFPTPTINA